MFVSSCYDVELKEFPQQGIFSEVSLKQKLNNVQNVIADDGTV